MRETGLAKETVRRFYRAGAVEQLLAKVKDGRPSLLDDHKPYLHQRWNEGCTNVRQLHAELKERGYKGGYGTIRDYVLPFREAGAAPPAVAGPPKARELASWILTHPENLGDNEKEKLARARCPSPRGWSGSAGCWTGTTRPRRASSSTSCPCTGRWEAPRSWPPR